MCSTEAHDRMRTTGKDDASCGGGRAMPTDSTEYVLVLLGLTLNFIENWLQSFKTNCIHQTTMYCDKMSELFKNNPVTILESNSDSYKNKRKMFLTYIRKKWHINKLRSKPSHI